MTPQIRRWLATLVAVPFVYPLLTACTSQPPAESLAYTIEKASNVRVDMLLTDTIDFGGECAYAIPTDETLQRSLLVFSKGSATVEDGKIKYGGKLYADGDKAEWGFYDRNIGSGDWLTIPEGCRDYSDLAVVVYPPD